MEEKNITLLIMAAGMGSRFGGLKQIEPVGPNKEFIIDYSIYDAIKAGFNKVVFVIKEENYEIFKETIGKRIEDKIKVEYAFQKLDDLPIAIDVSHREKPWGTGHAILAARHLINEPFGIINADDFYGSDAFLKLANFLKTNEEEYTMIGYQTGNTLSENGSVKRGVAQSIDGYLTQIIESSVEKINNQIIATPLDGSNSFNINDDTLVSMNMFGFQKNIMQYLENDFIKFLKNNQNIENLKSEFLIPEVIMNHINQNDIKVKIIKTTSIWHGITYLEDKPAIVESLNNYIKNSIYPSNLWQ